MSEVPTIEREAEDGMVHVGSIDSFEETNRLLLEVGNRQIAVFSAEDEFYALSNYCVHQGGPMCEGLLSGTMDTDEDGELLYNVDRRVVSCPWHGWEFDVEDGKHLSDPQYRLPSYDVVVEDEQLYVEL
jgi:nitrite reductase (NADH) small subunit